jgi:hypothetical protein
MGHESVGGSKSARQRSEPASAIEVFYRCQHSVNFNLRLRIEHCLFQQGIGDFD